MIDDEYMNQLLSQLQQLKSELNHEKELLRKKMKLSSGCSDAVPSFNIREYQGRIEQVEQALHKINIEVQGYCSECGATIINGEVDCPRTDGGCHHPAD